MQTANKLAQHEGPCRPRGGQTERGAAPPRPLDISVATPDDWITGSLQPLHRAPSLSAFTKPELRRELHRTALALDRVEGALQRATLADLERRWSMAAAGHDLRQPLQIMLLALDALTRRPERAIWTADILRGEIERLRDGLNHLAVASRVVPDEMELPSLEPVPLADLFEMLRARWTPIAEAKGLDLRVVGSELAVMSDSILLTSITDNLVGNAIKYTGRGSVLIGCRRAGLQVRVEVIDTGVGFDPADLARLAQPFCQGDSASEGMGLGLSLVCRAAQRLGHRLSVSSSLGRGACFAVTAARA